MTIVCPLSWSWSLNFPSSLSHIPILQLGCPTVGIGNRLTYGSSNQLEVQSETRKVRLRWILYPHLFLSPYHLSYSYSRLNPRSVLRRNSVRPSHVVSDRGSVTPTSLLGLLRWMWTVHLPSNPRGVRTYGSTVVRWTPKLWMGTSRSEIVHLT